MSCLYRWKKEITTTDIGVEEEEEEKEEEKERKWNDDVKLKEEKCEEPRPRSRGSEHVQKEV